MPDRVLKRQDEHHSHPAVSSEPPNARQGIETHGHDLLVRFCTKSEPPNARQGIETLLSSFQRVFQRVLSEPPNARQGIETNGAGRSIRITRCGCPNPRMPDRVLKLLLVRLNAKALV